MSDFVDTSAPQPLFRDIPQSSGEMARAFRSARPLALAFTLCAGLRITFTLVAIVGLLLRLKVLDDMRRLGPLLASTVQTQAHLVTRIVNTSVILGNIVYVVCCILGGMWIYRAARNVRALGAKGLTVSPGWAIGFYAIPIAAWFQPLVAMSEI